MKLLNLVVPDELYSRLLHLAAEFRADISAVSVALLADGLAAKHEGSSSPVTEGPGGRVDQPEDAPGRMAGDRFDVSREFRGYPPLSIELAQSFIDEAVRVGGAGPARVHGKIGVTPNFVFIEYLKKRAHTPGIGVSIYGNRSNYPEVADLLKEGRTPSYSRAVIHTHIELKRLLPVIGKAYELRVRT